MRPAIRGTRLSTLAVLCASMLACGDKPPVAPPGPGIDQEPTGPTPQQLARQQRDEQRRQSLTEMNRGVEAAAAKELDTAEPHLRKAIDLDPDNHAAHYNLGIVLYAKGDFTTAIQYFERAQQLHESADYQLALGRALFRNGSYQAARTALADAAVAKPSLHEAHYYLGLIHVRQGRREESITPLRECTRLTKSIAGCFGFLAEAHYELNELEAAIEAATDGLQHHAGDPLMSFVLGKAQLVSGKAKDAALTLGDLAKARPNDTDAQLWWAMALAQAGNRKKARSVIKQVAASLGDDAGRYDVDFARGLARRKRRATDKPLAPGAGETTPSRLRVEYAKHLNKRIDVRGWVAWKYDCARVIGKKAARTEPERCARPHFYLGATRSPWPDRALWVVDVPRPPRPDEKKAFDEKTLANWPKVPSYKVGQKVVVTGTWATESPQGFAKSQGLLVFESLEPANKP